MRASFVSSGSFRQAACHSARGLARWRIAAEPSLPILPECRRCRPSPLPRATPFTRCAGWRGCCSFMSL
ncbi:hypothetical protein HMPREF9946_02766 [Acetobacteraceae bacterium AT-5844]|nr:hypothetical protein HMPREF9946_02766 [Acetobacteraceae bacterium AT-5844]